MLSRNVLFFLLCSCSFVMNASAADRRVRVVNKSSNSIVGLFASNVTKNRWTYNMMVGHRPVEPDDYIIADMDDGTGFCQYDVKAIMDDGREAVHYNMNVCRMEEWDVLD